jgi:hypothetical protein
MGGLTRAALWTVTLLLLGLLLHWLVGWSAPLTTMVGVVVVLVVVWLVRTWADARRPEFQAQVTTYSPWNNDLTLYLLKPMHLYGTRCEVARTGDGVVRSAELVKELYGAWLGRPAPVTFPYPSGFSPKDGSTPEPGETCAVAWYVRDRRNGSWRRVAEHEFRSGFELRNALHDESAVGALE